MRGRSSIASGPALAALLALAPAPARAQGDAVETARVLYSVGAAAYSAGNFPAAIHAFEQAQKLAPRPAIAFSLAQSYRKQFFIDKQPGSIARAITLYRGYLAAVPEGGRRAEAAQYVAELDPIAERLGPMPSGGDSGLSPASSRTRIMISSPTVGATVTIDADKPAPAPLFIEAKPGKHSLTIAAPGHFDESRSFDLEPGSVVGLDITLRERPAQVTLDTADGAQISIDGRFVAAAPLPAAIELAPGPHLFTITKNGYRAFTDEIELGRGESRSIPAPLERTGQRIAALTLFGAGGAGLIAGGVLLGFAVVAEGRAKDILAEGDLGNASPERLDAYGRAVDSRSDLRGAAIVTLGAGAAAGITGLLLYALDQPSVSVKRAPKKQPDAPAAATPTDVAVAPIIDPTKLGASLSFEF